MNYELCKKLKDAGFPQTWPKPDFLEIHDAVEISKIYEKYPNEFNPYRPTLSELIEACGDEFPVLTKEKKEWLCMDVYCGNLVDVLSRGLTPQEAVANLWLVLKVKI